MNEDAQSRRTPISIISAPSDLEGYTHDVFVNGTRRISFDVDRIEGSDILEIVALSMQIGSELLLKDMGRTVIDSSEEEH